MILCMNTNPISVEICNELKLCRKKLTDIDQCIKNCKQSNKK